jgi:hypothetical protein
VILSAVNLSGLISTLRRAPSEADSRPDLAPGQFRRQSTLGSDAIYRIARLAGPVVEVEVLHAPGLSSGRRFRLTRGSVLGMAAVQTFSPQIAPQIGHAALH